LTRSWCGSIGLELLLLLLAADKITSDERFRLGHARLSLSDSQSASWQTSRVREFWFQKRKEKFVKTLILNSSFLLLSDTSVKSKSTRMWIILKWVFSSFHLYAHARSFDQLLAKQKSSRQLFMLNVAKRKTFPQISLMSEILFDDLEKKNKNKILRIIRQL
jgi:hypothetical protein